MITELCQRCWLFHAPERDCKEALADGKAWLVKPPVDDPAPVAAEAEPTPAPVAQKAKRKYERKARAPR